MKNWYHSKTLWTNIIAIFTVPLAVRYGIEINTEDAVALLGAINLILRIATKQPLQ